MIRQRIREILNKWLRGYQINMPHHEREAIENAMYEYGSLRAKQVTYFWGTVILLYVLLSNILK